MGQAEGAACAVNQRVKKKALKIALAGRLLWDPWFRDTFGLRAAMDVADELLRKAKFPHGIKVPIPEQPHEAFRIARNVARTENRTTGERYSEPPPEQMKES